MRLLFLLCLLCCLGLPLPRQAQAAMRVALLLDQEQDHGYADTVRAGLHKAQQELGIEVHTFTTADAAEQEEAFKKAAGGPFDLVVVATPPFHELLLNNAGNYRKQRFICLDESVKAPNIVSVLYADAQAAFLAGAAAAMFSTAKDIAHVDAAPVIGFVGARDTEQQRYMLEAYSAGARLVEPQTRVLTAFAGSQHSPAAGKAAARDLYARGADIILHNAGQSGLGVLEAAREAQGYAIGMGQDQHGLAPGHVLLSQSKDAAPALLALLKDSMAGNFPGGQVLEKDMRDKSVGLVGLQHLRAPLGPAFPAHILTRLKELEYEITRGGISLGVPRKKSLCDCL